MGKTVDELKAYLANRSVKYSEHTLESGRVVECDNAIDWSPQEGERSLEEILAVLGDIENRAEAWDSVFEPMELWN